MNDRRVVQDDRGGTLVDHRVGATHSAPESRESAVGERVRTAGPTAEDRLRAVLSVLSSRTSCAQEALRRGVAEADVERWKRLFIDSGRQGLLLSGRLKPQPSAGSLGAQNAALKSALRKKLTELRACRQMAHELLGPFVRVEEIRQESEITISRFCVLIDVSRRTYFRRLVLLKYARSPEDGHDSTSITSTCAQLVEDYLAKNPGYGHRRIHGLMIADGHMVSASTVLRAIRTSQRQERGEPQADGGSTRSHLAHCSCQGCEVDEVDADRPRAADPGAVGLVDLMAIVAAALNDLRANTIGEGARGVSGLSIPSNAAAPLGPARL